MVDNETSLDFEKYVNAHYREAMNVCSMVNVIKPPQSGAETEAEAACRTGFVMGLQWIGKLMGLNLAMPGAEVRAHIDAAIEQSEGKE